MKSPIRALATLSAFVVSVAPAALSGCSQNEAKPVFGLTPQKMADALFAVMSADRAVYTKQVVNRLQNEDKVIKASEHWKDDNSEKLYDLSTS